jgi:hypothetical protein
LISKCQAGQLRERRLSKRCDRREAHKAEARKRDIVTLQASTP